MKINKRKENHCSIFSKSYLYSTRKQNNLSDLEKLFYSLIYCINKLELIKHYHLRNYIFELN